MSGWLLDVKLAARYLIKHPTVSFVIVLTLAVGIAANTVMFAGYDTWALRPLPFDDPERLVALVESHPATGKHQYPVSAANLRDWQEQQQAFAGIGVYAYRSYNFHNEDQPERVRGAAISATLFPLLGIEPILGRGFLDEEVRPGGPAVALIGHTLWKQRFAADPEVEGTTFRLDGMVHQVVGVMPPDFKFPEFVEVWTPLDHDPALVPRDQRNLRVVARLAPGVSIADAGDQLTAIAERLAAAYPESNQGWTAHVLQLRDLFVPATVQVALAASMASAWLVLLIICANVANLMLAQATYRHQETAVRAALGASRWRLVRQVLSESLVLALAAGMLGVVLGKLALHWMMSWIPVEPPYMFAFKNDGRALLYTLVVSLAAGLVCGLAPILRSAGRNLFTALRSGGRQAGESVRSARLRSLLVVAELSMAVLLAVCALLVVKSYLNRQNVQRGYQVSDVVTLRLSLTGESFADVKRRVSFLDEALTAIAGNPKVAAAGVANHLPESRTGYQRVRLEIEGMPRARGEEVETTLYAISRGYLESIGVPLLHGRSFTNNELHNGGHTVLVGESLATLLWPNDSAVGHQIRLLGNQQWLRIVGVVGAVDPGHRLVQSGTRPRTQIYLPYTDVLSPLVTLAVRSNHDPIALAAEIRTQLADIDPGVAASDPLTMDEAIFKVQWVARYFSKQLSLYAALALLVAALGVYGVTADAVARRRREMGIRLALGAAPRTLMRMVLRQGLILGGSGVCLGLLAALPLTGLISALLFAVDARDPLVFVGVGLVLTVSAALACYLPARRAAGINPIDTLRFE